MHETTIKKMHETTITTTTEQPVHIITGGIHLCICCRLKKSHVFRYHTCRTVSKGFPNAIEGQEPNWTRKMGHDEEVVALCANAESSLWPNMGI